MDGNHENFTTLVKCLASFQEFETVSWSARTEMQAQPTKMRLTWHVCTGCLVINYWLLGNLLLVTW